MRIRLSLLMLLCMALPSLAATGLTGTLVDASTGKAVADANVLLRDQAIFVTTGSDGTFTISNAAPGTDVLEIIANGYADAWHDVTIVKDMVKNIGEIRLQPAGFEGATPDSDQFLFNEDEILDDEGMGQSVGTIQGATDDIYYQTSNYDFSVARFRWRGYDTNWNAGYINGIYFNDAMRGRFNFSGLGGMTSSAFRNRSTDIGLAASAYGYGSLGARAISPRMRRNMLPASAETSPTPTPTICFAPCSSTAPVSTATAGHSRQASSGVTLRRV